VLLIAAERDNIAPVKSVHEVARRLGGRVEELPFDCSHFDIYVGEVFEESSTAQVASLRRELAAVTEGARAARRR
jgi:poly(3-hydroxyalkanoate) synthetase